MPEKVLLIQHMDDGGSDRVACHLTDRGFVLHWCNPSRGDALPLPGEEFAAVVVYGGIQSVNDAERQAYIRAELDWIQRWVADHRPYLGVTGAGVRTCCLPATMGPCSPTWCR